MARDLFEHKDLEIFSSSFSVTVNPSGVVMVKLTPLMYSADDLDHVGDK